MKQIINDDALKVLKQIKDESIDLIVTDVPYKTTKRGCSGTTGGMLKKDINKKGKVFKYNDVKPIDYLPDFYRVLKEGTHCYIMTNHKNLKEMLNTATECGFKFIKSLIWNKGNKIMGGFYMSQFEYILFFRKGKAKRINNCGTSDILNVPNKKTKNEFGKNIHDTEKPVDLMQILIENSSNEKDVVLDAFCGVGSTLLACERLNRNYIGIEIDETYYNITCDRISKQLENTEVA